MMAMVKCAVGTSEIVLETFAIHGSLRTLSKLRASYFPTFFEQKLLFLLPHCGIRKTKTEIKNKSRPTL